MRKIKPTDKLKDSVPVRHDIAADLSEWTGDDSEQSMEDLRNSVRKEVLSLFEGDETSAREWMKRTRPFLGNVTPEEMLDSAENIRRLRRFVQQIERGIFP